MAQELVAWAANRPCAVHSSPRKSRKKNYMTDRLAEIRERNKKRSPGQWEATNGMGSYIKAPPPAGVFAHLYGRVARQDSVDADFIAHAPTDIEWLITEIERLHAENEQLRRVKTIYSYFTDDNQTSVELSAKYLREAPQTEPELTVYMQRVFRLDDEPLQVETDSVFPEPERERVRGVIIGSRVR